MRLSQLTAALLCAGTTLLSSPPAFADAVTDRAKQLIDTQKGKEAFALLLPLEAQRAGEAEFDLLLGLAALDAGDPQRAIFALERVLAVQPNNGPARAAIGRAFAEVGDKANARQELESARTSAPTPEARAVIDKYLSALAANSERRFNAYVAATLGHDSNINSATGQSTIFVPLFSAVVPYTGGKQRAGYWNLGAGFDGALPIAGEWSLVGGGDLSFRDNISKRYDTWNGNLRGGVRWDQAGGPNAVTLALTANETSVDDPAGKSRRRAVGGLVQWQYQLSETAQVGVVAQSQKLRFPGASIRDARRDTIGVNAGKSFTGSLKPYLFASVYTGRERTNDSAFNFLGHKPTGGLVGLQIQPASAWDLFASVGYEERKYSGFDALWAVTRRDRTTDLRLGATWKFAPTWSLSPAASYTRNSSNVVVSAYTKATLSATVRKDF